MADLERILPTGPLFHPRFVTPEFSDPESDFFRAQEVIDGEVVHTIIKECDPFKVENEQLFLYAEITNEAASKAEELHIMGKVPSDTTDDITVMLEVNKILRIQEGRNGRLQSVSRVVEGPTLEELLKAAERFKAGAEPLDYTKIGKITTEQRHWFDWIIRSLTRPEIVERWVANLDRFSDVMNSELRTIGVKFSPKDGILEVEPKVSLIKYKATDIALRVNDVQRRSRLDWPEGDV